MGSVGTTPQGRSCGWCVVDVQVEHPSCSKQHAVLQFRMRESKDAMGMPQHVIKYVLADICKSRWQEAHISMHSSASNSMITDDLSVGMGRGRPYIMDLESVNKTKLNGEFIPPARYIELKVRQKKAFIQKHACS